jgi:hypothetical protein
MCARILALALLLSSAADAQTAIDFALSRAYLHQLAASKGDVVGISVLLTHRTNTVHSLESDCEMHLAGSPTGTALSDPSAVVVEPPNLCKFAPSTGGGWGALFDSHVINRDCVATGYPRIFTEHAAGGSEGSPNPNHVLEIHPALRIACGNDVIEFTSYLKYFPKLRAIAPASASECLQTRTVSMRYSPTGKRYEFLQDGGHKCGNFLIAEIAFVDPSWVRAIAGGHSTIARVSVDGQSRTTLKLYTLAGTPADEWLASVAHNGLGQDRVYVHGMLTYDYFAFVKTVRTKAGHWTNPNNWTKVEYPLALVVFGFPTEPPWHEED